MVEMLKFDAVTTDRLLSRQLYRMRQPTCTKSCVFHSKALLGMTHCVGYLFGHCRSILRRDFLIYYLFNIFYVIEALYIQ